MLPESLRHRPFLGQIAYWAVWLFVFSLPSEKSMEIPGFGTISRLAGALAMGVMVLFLLTELRMRKPRAAHLVLAAFVLWSAITMRWSADPLNTGEKIASFIQLFVLVMLIWESCAVEDQARTMLAAYVLGTFVPFADSVSRFLSGKQTYYQRFATTGFDPNDSALTMALSIPMAYYLTLVSRGAWRWVFRTQMVIAVGAIFLTASRGGTVAMVVALSLVYTTRKALDRKQRLAIAAVVALAIPAAVMLVPATSWTRIATLKSEVTTGTLNSRTLIWGGGWDAFHDAPMHGVGSGAYPEMIVPLMGRPWGFTPVAHNTFLSVLVETGLIGFGIYLGLLLLLVRMALQLPWVEKRFWLTMLAVWAIGVSSLTWEHRKPTWLLFGLLAAHASTMIRRTNTGRIPVHAHGPILNIHATEGSAA